MFSNLFSNLGLIVEFCEFQPLTVRNNYSRNVKSFISRLVILCYTV